MTQALKTIAVSIFVFLLACCGPTEEVGPGGSIWLLEEPDSGRPGSCFCLILHFGYPGEPPQATEILLADDWSNRPDPLSVETFQVGEEIWIPVSALGLRVHRALCFTPEEDYGEQVDFEQGT